jgi:uncharacterized membrane protein YjdF
VFAYGFLESEFQQYETSVVDGMHHELSKKHIYCRLVCLVRELFDRHGDCTGGSRVWMAASILPVLLVVGLVVSYRSFPLSSISYFLITLLGVDPTLTLESMS